MKSYKLIGLFATFQFFGTTYAQTSYPNAPSATVNIVKAEYYIDNDPGLGLAIPINISPAKTITDKTIEIPLTGISKGVHFFSLRTQDANGKWS